MCGENDGGALFLKGADLVLEHIGIDGIKAAEGFIEDQQFRFMQKRQVTLLFAKWLDTD